MFKALIAGGRFDKAAGAIKRVDPPLNFADILYPVIKDHVVKWATGPSSFTVLGLVEAPDFSSKKELLKILRSDKKTLEAAAAADAAGKADKADGKKSKSKGKGSQSEKGKSSGNQGAKLLLEKLAA
jgi:pumilio family protein 6